MAVDAIKIQSSYRDTLNFSISSKVSQETALLKALEKKKYWDELLEKLRKSGGGGGNDNRFDRIAVSMMLSNFLTNKMILALMRNLGINLESILSSVIKTESKSPINLFINLASNIHKIPVLILGLIQTSLTRFTNIMMIQKTVKLFNEIAGILSFQLNKLKETIDEKTKELIRKFNVKEKTKKIKAVINSILNETLGYIFHFFVTQGIIKK